MTPQLPSHVRSIIDAEGAVLLDLRQGRYYSLNSVGAHIWQRLEKGWPLSRIEPELVERHGISPATAARDVSNFLTDLKRKRLL